MIAKTCGFGQIAEDLKKGKINNKEDIFEKLHQTYPKIYYNFDGFELCYPQPKIFLDIHQ